jgi:hypothetical protein
VFGVDHHSCADLPGRHHAGGVAVVIELDGLLWEPVPGSAVSAEEFIAARSLIREIHEPLWWSPWVLTDRAAEYDAALEA